MMFHQHGLLAITVAGVWPPISGFAAQMLVHLGVQHPFRQCLLQRVKHAVWIEHAASDRPRRAAGQEGHPE
jgi:hypothetical protein